MIQFLRLLWAEPAMTNRRGPYWLDWFLVATLVPTAVLEGVLRPDLVWPVISIVLAVALVVALPWRRLYPLPTLVGSLVSILAVELTSLIVGVEWEGLYTVAVILITPYALARWAAGWEIEVGVAAMAVHYTVTWSINFTDFGELIGGALVFFAPIALGTVVRYQHNARTRGIAEVKHRERELLARELHDTVAHHVSAIAIQAQAGQAVAATSPETALEALRVIEEEASRTLAEMRTMIGALREEGEEADLAPQRGVADIERLAASSGGRTPITVELTGPLHDLRPSVDAAVYRLAQESITNALRHARRATGIAVRVSGDDDRVHLTVADDGESSSLGPPPSGFGLIGMAERAALLGGTVEAGPRPERGWLVTAVLPRNGVAR